MSGSPSSIPGQDSVATFRDAVGLAMAIADEYAFANVAALISGGQQHGSPPPGTVLDSIVAEGIGGTIQPLVAWAAAASQRQPAHGRSRPGEPTPPIDVLLLSIRPYEVDIVRERDLRLFRQARWATAAAGLNLVDWIETDGDLFRSYAYVTCPAEAWADDPPTERLWDQPSS